ncbi:KHG/KDPG aldolase [Iodidimonas gelatinilytica]|uniref:2-dehydro-3-deoxy-phosphogluconate aldolase n=1 Tax=Iodidimonas gelatinilytica TaxID=1236966 RepID=A0A5A7N0W0_9PROT|nr:bifunctional 4-hydroxy-2-oxoglutarate aldolase/2-dehydro-3-deoxy-phosphogluconate aldolase [Iodidimonas gelatinilytica]GER00799.1 KHG/KDPG aldolase [Iodidimonas gelatinilytica]
MTQAIHTIMTTAPVIPVLAIDHIEHAVPLAQALVAGGLRVLEITLRTDAAIPAIEAMTQQVPGAIVGAGTIRTPDDLKRVEQAGARFAVSPGLTDAVAKAAQTSTVPLLPGVATASEVMRANDHGFDHLKFFPAESSGGVAAIKNFSGPFPNVFFCPTGGINATKARDYLNLANVLCVGGSWVAPKNAVQHENWAEIERLSKDAFHNAAGPAAG